MASSSTVVVIEPVLMKGKKDLSGVRKRGKGDIVPEFPPLPLESDLFTPPVGERNVRKADLKVLAEAVMNMMPMEGKFVNIDTFIFEIKYNKVSI